MTGWMTKLQIYTFINIIRETQLAQEFVSVAEYHNE